MGVTVTVRPLFVRNVTSSSFTATRRLLAMPTPRIEPINVCELETGNPRYHVPRFHVTPASNSASTETSAIWLRESTSRSTGRRLTMLKATAVPPRSTPKKLQVPEYKTAGKGRSVRV